MRQSECLTFNAGQQTTGQVSFCENLYKGGWVRIVRRLRLPAQITGEVCQYCDGICPSETHPSVGLRSYRAPEPQQIL